MAELHKRSRRRKTETTVRATKQNTRKAGQYSDEEKITAITAMFRENIDHPYCEASRAAAAAVLGCEPSLQTLQQWMKQYSSQVRALIVKPTVETVVNQVSGEMIGQWGKIRDRYQAHLLDPLTVATATARDAVIAAGTAQDKLDRAKGLSPQVMNKITAILKLCEIGSLDPELALEDLRQNIQDYLQSRTIYIEAHSTQDMPDTSASSIDVTPVRNDDNTGDSGDKLA